MNEEEFGEADAVEVKTVFWPFGVAHRPFAEQLKIASAGQFNCLAVSPYTSRRLFASGLSPQDVLEQAADYGIELDFLDGIATWVSQWQPDPNSPGGAVLREMFDIPVNEALDLGAALNMKSAVAVGLYPAGSVAPDEIHDGFASLCDAAQSCGIAISLEFMPASGVPDLESAWNIVRHAGRDNSSIVVDTWHLQRSAPDFEATLDLLDNIPKDRLPHVQLADANLAMQGATVSDDVMYRKFAGEGELDIDRPLGIIAKKGGLQSVGPEVVNSDLASMSCEAIGEVAGRTTRAALTRALHQNVESNRVAPEQDR